MADATERSDVSALQREMLAPWINASWEALDQLEAAEPREEELVAASGRRYRVKLEGVWDMNPWESDFYVRAYVHGHSGWRRRFPYLDVVGHGGEDLPAVPPATTRWVKNRRGKWRLRSDRQPVAELPPSRRPPPV